MRRFDIINSNIDLLRESGMIRLVSISRPVSHRQPKDPSATDILLKSKFEKAASSRKTENRLI